MLLPIRKYKQHSDSMLWEVSMPKKTSRRKQREEKLRAKLRRREHPDCINGGRLNAYRRFCVFMRIWWIVYPLLFCGTLFTALLLESWTMAWMGISLLPLPLAVNIIRQVCFEWKLVCPRCDRPGVARWYDRGGWERLSDIRPRRRYYQELKKSTDTYICPYCGKLIYILPHAEYKKICGKVRKNRE